MGWTVTGLLLTLDVVPASEPAAAELRGIFVTVMKSILRAQDHETGAWWQVMDFPDRSGNYLESSATGLFAHAIVRGLRLGYLDAVDGVAPSEYLASAKKAFGWLQDNAVLHLDDGTLGYNLTVDVCSINSTTSFEVSTTNCRQAFRPSL
jgi:unsaturated rhamnogalacturonyl hydrolase